MKVLKPLLASARKQDVSEALGALPALGVKKIGKALNVAIKGDKFLRMQEIFDKNTLPRIINVYNTFVDFRNGNLSLIKNTLNVGADVFSEFIPLIEILIENKGKVSVSEIISIVLEKLGGTKTTTELKGLSDYKALQKEAKELGFQGRGKKQELINFIETQKA